jgi:hypothetical protein
MREFGGYRLVRTLGGGDRGEVWLGRQDDIGASSEQDGSMPAPRLVAVKVFRRKVERASINAEVEALTRVSSRHIMGLLDLTEDSSGLPCLIAQQLDPGGLPRLLSDRTTISAGEAITVLAPIAASLRSLHRAGVVHGGLRASKVLFDDEGAPVIAGFGSSRLFAPRGRPVTRVQRAEEAGVSDDLARLAALARGVLLRTYEVEQTAAILEWLDSTMATVPLGTFAEEFTQRLFDVADPMPLHANGAGPVHAQPRASSLSSGRAAAIANGENPSAPRGLPDGRPPWLRALGLPDWLENLIAQLLKGELEKRLVRLRRSLAAVRTPVKVVGAAAVLSIVGTLAVIGAASPSASAPVAAPSSGAEVENYPAPSRGGYVQPAPSVLADAIGGDDPIAAATALLSRRAACLNELSVICLDGVDQLDSAAWEADQHAVRSAQESGTPIELFDFGEDGLVLVDRMGDTALLALGTTQESDEREPASVLVIRTEAGWRIRDVLRS